MPGRVTSYETKTQQGVQPNTLHGVKEVPLLVMQCADKRGTVQVLLGLEIEPGDVRTFPSDTWERLGRPHAWLQEQIDDVRNPKSRVASKKPTAQTEQAEVGTNVDPMM